MGDKRNHYCQCYFIIGPFGTDMGSVIANGGLQLSNDESLRRAERKLGTLHLRLYAFMANGGVARKVKVVGG